MADWCTNLSQSERGCRITARGREGLCSLAAVPEGKGLCLPPPLDQLFSGGVTVGFPQASCAGGFLWQ